MTQHQRNLIKLAHGYNVRMARMTNDGPMCIACSVRRALPDSLLCYQDTQRIHEADSYAESVAGIHQDMRKSGIHLSNATMRDLS